MTFLNTKFVLIPIKCNSLQLVHSSYHFVLSNTLNQIYPLNVDEKKCCTHLAFAPVNYECK
jgi:CBS-domain-containing membrane protein